MTPAFSSFVRVALGAGPLALLAKVTMMLVATAIVALVLARASAAIRHTVWLAGLVGALGLTLANPLAPALRVRVFSASATVVNNASRPRMPTAVRAASPARAGRVDRIEVVRTSPVSVGRSGLVVDGAFVGAFVWLLGLAVVLARCVWGHIVIARVVRRAVPADAAWRVAARASLASVDIARDVRILMSADIGGPVTTGTLRPTIIVPVDSADWSGERRDVVLTHELAHIARFDYLAQLVATVVCAIFWFHPFVWIAAARLRAEAEHAADDRVLTSGTPAVSYATHLLDLARVDSAAPLSAAVAVGMVRASRLEGRVRAMLDFDRSRAAVSPRLQMVATSLTLAAMVPVAGLRAVVLPRTLPPGLSTTIAFASPQIRPASADSVFEKTVNASSGETLSLDLETGGDVTLRGWDEARVRVRGQLAGNDWRDTRVSLERMGSGVRLRTDFDGYSDQRRTRHVFEIWVPRHMNVELTSAGGSLAINDVNGEFRGHTGGGSMILEGAAGSARLSTGGGNVRVVNSNLSGSVSTGGGEVILSNVTGGLRASSGSGPIINVPGIVEGTPITTSSGGVSTTTISGGFGGSSATAISGGVGSGAGFGATAIGGTGRTMSTTGSTGRYERITTFGNDVTTIGSGGRDVVAGSGYVISRAGGSIEVADVPRDAAVHTGGGRIYIGSASGRLHVSTGGGDIDLPRVAGGVSASTGAGAVSITIVDGDGAEHSVEVYTGKGRVTLELPASLDARFELESAYTETQPRTRIESDFDLQTTETTAWDDTEGTPRRYVRAIGSVGRGRDLIRVRAVNGDIVVRRANR